MGRIRLGEPGRSGIRPPRRNGGVLLPVPEVRVRGSPPRGPKDLRGRGKLENPRGELFRVLPLRPDPPGPEPDHALHVRGLHSVSYAGTASPNFNGGFMEFSKDYTSMVWSGYTKRPPLRG